MTDAERAEFIRDAETKQAAWAISRQAWTAQHIQQRPAEGWGSEAENRQAE